MPRDFLYYDEENGGMVWLWALTESGETYDRLHKEVNANADVGSNIEWMRNLAGIKSN
ncbi:hypothetical protein [Lacrimispora sp.]|uniref:hypothetical protein n=1 Tax=Lacrimispora sp. TaxID=2719234 RepID=UPI00286D84A8|nr:hypothetical protein [Lacrimispora sp.]